MHPDSRQTTAPSVPNQTAPVLDRRRRTLVLATMCLALVAVVASVSGLNVALYDLSVELEASTSALLWVVNAYTLTMAALLLPIGEIGDRIGRRTVLTAGLIVFAVANGLAITADSASVMIAYRALAGVGAAMVMPATLSTLTSVFPADERGRAVGIWAGFAGAGGILGLFSSSVLIDYASWEFVFVMPIVLAALSLILTQVYVPNTRSSETHRLDYFGGILSAVAVGGIVLGIHEGPEIGWLAPVTVVGLGGGLIALVAFVAWELRTEHPLLDVRIFTNRALAAGSFSLLALFALMFGSFLVVIQYLQGVLELSAVQSAAGLLPMALVMMSLSPVAPRFSSRFGLGRVLTIGAMFLGAGFALLGLLSADSTYLAVVPGLILVGIGIGLAMSPATTAITESLPSEKQGVASALNDTVREAGSSLGIALIGSILAAGYSSEIATTVTQLPEPLAEPVGEGIGQAMVVAALLGDQGAVVVEAAQSAFMNGWSLAMFVAAATAVASGLISGSIFGGSKSLVPVSVSPLPSSKPLITSESSPSVSA